MVKLGERELTFGQPHLTQEILVPRVLNLWLAIQKCLHPKIKYQKH